ncbi:MAG: tetratricopeptide repeat protein [Candidatus Zixiibacteriota bacterium]|jgi:Tfp pilus assembly protein PilF
MKNRLLRVAPAAGVVAVALAVRLAYFAGMCDFPLFHAPTGDTVEYADDARVILAGEVLGRDVYFHSSPAYPYFLAAVAKISGNDLGDLRTIALLQLLASALTAGLLYALGRKLMGRWGGVAAGLVYALSPTAVFYDGELLMDFLLPPVLVGAALLAAGGKDGVRVRRAVAAGALVAFGALARPNYLLLLLPLGLALWWQAKEASRRRRIAIVAALVAAAAAVVLPVTVRNYAVGRDFVVISSNGGVNFYIGNNPQANGTFKAPGPWPSHLEASSAAFAEEAEGRALRPSEVSAFFTREALRYIFTQPVDFAGKVGRRLRLLASSYEIPNHMAFDFFRARSTVLKILPFTWGIVLPWALGGAVLVARDRKYRPALGLAAVYVASLAFLFFITGRYRFPVFPLLALFAVAGVFAAAAALRSRTWWKVVVYAALVAGAYGAAYFPAPADVRVSDAYSYHHLGAVYAARGDDLAAARAYEKAVEIEPEDSFSWNNMGLAYIRMDNMPAAERALGRALELSPDNPETLSNYGTMLLYQGRVSEAERYVKAALAGDPNCVAALVNYGIILMARRDLDGAMRTLERAAVIEPAYPNTYFNMGLVHEARGDFAAAAAAYRRGLAFDPGNAEAQRRLAMLEGRTR